MNPGGPTDRYKDLALDAQYQYLVEPHSFTAQATWIHEKTDWNASYPLASAANHSDRLDTFRIKGSYLYRNRYGATLSTTGDADVPRYADPTPVTGNSTGSPDTKGYIMELD
ncbi:MAG: cytochrome C, partial [Sulfuricella sp.]